MSSKGGTKEKLMGNALIRVIVPIYKTEAYLERCVSSLLKQTEPRFHLVLVDDGSPDRCGEIADQLAQTDSRIKVIHQQNAGLSAARNAGLDITDECSYITFVDSDDWVEPEYLENLLMLAIRTGCAMVVGGHAKVRGPEEKIPQSTLKPIVCTPEECYCMKCVSVTPAWGKLYRRELFSNMRFPEDRIHEDYYVTWKLVFQQKQVAVTPQPLYRYYTNTQGIMRSTWTPRHMDFFQAIDEKIAWFGSRGYEKAKRRAVFKALRTTEKYLCRVKETSYAADFIDTLKQKMEMYSRIYVEMNETSKSEAEKVQEDG